MADPTTTDAPVQAEPGVGFVGCDRRSRILRVRVANRHRQHMRVECPHGCGEHSTPRAMARPLRSDEAAPELVELPPEDPDADSHDPTVLRHRQQVSDAAILAAVTEDETLIAEMSKALGYAEGKSGSLLERMRRMNGRAEKRDEPPPFQIRKAGRNLVVRSAP